MGHLGTAELAGAGVGTAVVQTAVGLLVFLAYATTPAVARLLGQGERAAALAVGRDGIYLAAGLGVVVAVAGWVWAPALASALGAAGAEAGFAVDYIRWAAPGMPAMLVVLAATGVLRGWQDTRTPLAVAGAGAAVNVGLNWLLVYGVGMSVAGSALGTTLVQWGSAAVYVVIIVPRMRRLRVPLAPSVRGVLHVGHVGGWLLVRTLGLRAALLLTLNAAARSGQTSLAAHQIVFTLFTFMAFALDALAIAAQALVGKARGERDADELRQLRGTLTRWALLFGLVVGAALALASPWIGHLFTSDPEVVDAVGQATLVLAAAQPLAGVVFVLDGVLIGAEDMAYLAGASLATLAVYAAVLRVAVTLPLPPVTAIWIAFTLGFLGTRAVTLVWRAWQPGAPAFRL